MSSQCFNLIKLEGEPLTIISLYYMIKDMKEAKPEYDEANGMEYHRGLFERLVDRHNGGDLDDFGTCDISPDELWDLTLISENKFEFTFNSRNSPADVFFRKMCEKYKLKGYMMYDDQEADYYGDILIEDIRDIKEHCWEYLEGQYHLDKVSFWENIYSNQFEYWHDYEITEEQIRQEVPFLSPDEFYQMIKEYNEYQLQNN